MTIETPGIEAPPPEPVEPVATNQEGLLETAVSVITEPVSTLKHVTTEANLGWAFAVTAVIGLLSSVAGVAQLRAAPPPETPGFPELTGPLAFAGAIIGGPIAAVVGLAIGTGVLHLVSLMLSGKGRYRGLFCGLAFASVPNLLQIPFQLAGIALGPIAQALGGIINFGITIWVVSLAVIAVRENNEGFSTGRAVAVVLIPLAVVFVLVFLLVAVIIALTVGAAGGFLTG